MSAYLGIDLGTQSVRALVVRADGEVLGSGRHPLTSIRDGVRHEQDPDEWWQAVVGSCQEALAGLSVPLGGVALCATSGTVLAADHAGRALSPGLMYDDVRAVDEAARLNDVGARFWAEQGYQRMQVAWGAPKLAWLTRHYAPPRLLTQADYLTWRLAGVPVPGDVSNHLKSGCDPERAAWPEQLLRDGGVAVEALPELVVSGTRLGVVGTAAAEATGIAVGTPIYAGMTDGCAGQLATGAIRPGSWSSTLGTTLILKGTATQRPSDPTGAVYSHRGPGDTWLPGAASGVGAPALERLLGKEPDHQALTEAAATRGAWRDSPLVVYPLAASTGERFPFVRPDAEPFVLADGGAPVDDVELYAATLRGVALVERLCLDHLSEIGAGRADELRISGGAVANRVWNQLRADVLGLPLAVSSSVEPAFGMAVLAAATAFGGVQQAATAMVRTDETYQPDPDAARWVAPAYEALLDELLRRGWIGPETVLHAKESLA